MNWDKKIYPKDVWNWIKEHLPYWPWDITGGIKATIRDRFLPNTRIRVNQKTIYRGKNRKGGFTPRRSVSRVDRAYFDTDDFFDALDREDGLDGVIERIKKRIDIEKLKELDEEDRWAMHNYDLAERTGLWDSNMADGPLIDGKPNIKIERG
jgi:hypothetical protein